MNYRDFFKNHKATAKDIQNLIPEGVDPKEFQMGIRDEKEHTKDEFIVAKIAGDHLRQDAKYYTKLNNAGLEEDMEEHCGACEDDLGNEYDDNGGLPKVGGALAVPHLGQPIMMGKIINVGGLGKGPASGELSGMTNAAKDKGGVPVRPVNDKEPITAGGKSPDRSIASKSVGGAVVPGDGQNQGGLNSQGTIAGTSKLDENKIRVRKMFKEVLKEIRFDKATGKWVRLDEGGHKAGCSCGFCKNKGTFGKKKKTEKDDGKKDKKDDKKEDKKKSNKNPFAKKKDEVDETVDMKMGPSYKTVQPRQYKVMDDDFARTNQYDPEITEMYDDEEECMMNERYVALANAKRNLSEAELSELKTLREKIDKMSVNKRNFGLSQGGVEPNIFEGDKKWIQKAVKPSHKGYCTPMTKSTCTPHRKALAKRFKSGDLSEDGERSDFEIASTETDPSDYEKCPGCGKQNYMCDCPPKHGVEEGRCEDYPCCGHEAGDCPDSEGRFTCVGCGKRLPRNAPSSICPRCQNRMSRLDQDDPTGQDSEMMFGGGEYQNETVNMKMGPSYKTVQPTLAKTADDDFARTNQYDPQVSEEESNNLKCMSCDKPLSSDTTTSVCKDCLEKNNNYQSDSRGYVSDLGVNEAGGGAVQHSSYRTVGSTKDPHGNLPQSGKQRWVDDLDEGKKKPSKVVKTITKGQKPHKTQKNPHLKHQTPKKTHSGVHKRKT